MEDHVSNHTVKIDAEVCQGHGRCYMLVPELFSSDDEGQGEVVQSVIGDDQLERARLAEFNCPENAITVTGQ